MPKKRASTKPPMLWVREIPATGSWKAEDKITSLAIITSRLKDFHGSQAVRFVTGLCYALSNDKKYPVDSRVNLFKKAVTIDISDIIADYTIDPNDTSLVREALMQTDSSGEASKVPYHYYAAAYSRARAGSWRGPGVLEDGYFWSLVNPLGQYCDIDGSLVTEPVERSPKGKWRNTMALRSFPK